MLKILFQELCSKPAMLKTMFQEEDFKLDRLAMLKTKFQEQD